MTTEKDIAQDQQIAENAERIARNEEAIKRQTEALEKIRDHYYPPPPPWWQKILGFGGKVVCVIMAYLGIAEAVDWIWNTRESQNLAQRYAEVGQRLCFKEGNVAGAALCYEKCIELDDGESDYKIALSFMKGMAIAVDLFGAERPLTDEERSQLDAAFVEASMLAEFDPEDPMPLVLQAQVFMLRGECDSALRTMEKAIACDPSRATVRVSACAVNFFAGKVDEARRQLAEAERLDPSLPLIPNWKGQLALIVDHDVAAAREAFGELVKRLPRVPLGYAMLGRALLAGEKPDVKAARASFERALSINAKQMIALMGMAETYEREGKLLVARLWLDRLIANDANALSAFVARARINGKLGDGEAAVADLTSAIAIAPFRANLYRLRADACEKAGDAAKAKADRAVAAELEQKGN